MKRVITVFVVVIALFTVSRSAFAQVPVPTESASGTVASIGIGYHPFDGLHASVSLDGATICRVVTFELETAAGASVYAKEKYDLLVAAWHDRSQVSISFTDPARVDHESSCRVLGVHLVGHADVPALGNGS